MAAPLADIPDSYIFFYRWICLCQAIVALSEYGDPSSMLYLRLFLGAGQGQAIDISSFVVSVLLSYCSQPREKKQIPLGRCLLFVLLVAGFFLCVPHPKPARVPSESEKNLTAQSKGKCEMMDVPELFTCPISLDLFSDPVTLSTGQTYDRSNIEKWLADGNSTCPVTMLKLHNTSLVPNHTLRHLIEQWLCTAPVFASMEVMLSTLKHNLQLPGSVPVTKLETLRLIKALSSESCARQANLVQAGFFDLLLWLLFQSPVPDNAEITELALDVVLNLLPWKEMDSLNMIGNDPNLVQLVFLLERGSSSTRTSLCHLVEAAAANLATEELCLKLGRKQRVMQVLVSLLVNKSDPRASEAAMRAVCSLCSLQANRGNAIREGVVDGLISYISRAGRNAGRALSAVEALLELDVGRRKVTKSPNAIGILVKMAFRVGSDQEGSEHAVGALLLVCYDSGRARTEAINAGVLTQLLLLLQSQSSPQAKAKARALLKLLRAMWAKDQGVP